MIFLFSFFASKKSLFSRADRHHSSQEIGLEICSSIRQLFVGHASASSRFVRRNDYLSRWIDVENSSIDSETTDSSNVVTVRRRKIFDAFLRIVAFFLVASFSSLNEGFCSVEQADLIQTYVEQKLSNLYKIDEILGKSLGKSSTQNNDEIDVKTSPKNDAENFPRIKSEPNPVDSMKNNKSQMVKNEFSSTLTSSSTINQRSPSPTKSNLSPGEVKAVSPSSLSDASPM